MITKQALEKELDSTLAQISSTRGLLNAAETKYRRALKHYETLSAVSRRLHQKKYRLERMLFSEKEPKP